MAHEIWNDNGVDAMFCVGQGAEAAWHKLGQRTPDAVTWQQAMTLAHLDWSVVLRDAYARDPKGNVTKLPSRGVFRDSDAALLGVVGPDYTPIQNRQAFDWVDSLLAVEQGAQYESAGALGMGERIWCLARVPGADFSVVANDVHEGYLLFTTAHDGTMSATCKLTSVRVVCQNTLTMALSSNGGTALRIRHTANAVARMEAAKRVMTGVVKDAQSLKAKMLALVSRRVTRENMTTVMDRLFPKPPEGQNDTKRNNVVADVLKLYEYSDNGAVQGIGGTAYALLNAVTQYVDHVRGARITEDRQRAGYTLPMARAENAVWGTGAALKAEALDVILDATDAAGIILPSKAYSM